MQTILQKLLGLSVIIGLVGSLYGQELYQIPSEIAPFYDSIERLIEYDLENAEKKLLETEELVNQNDVLGGWLYLLKGIVNIESGGISEAENHLTRALELSSEQIQNYRLEFLIHLWYSQIHRAKGDYELALKSIQKAEEGLVHLNDEKQEAEKNYLKAVYLVEVNNYQEASAYFERALSFHLENGDSSEIARDYSFKSVLQANLGKHDEALLAQEQSLSYTNESLYPKKYAIRLANLSISQNRKGNQKQAITSIRKAISIFEDSRDTTLLIRNYAKYAQILSNSNLIIAANAYANKGLELSQAMGNKRMEAIYYGKLCQINKGSKDCIAYGLKAIEIARTEGFLPHMREALYKIIIEKYNASNDYQKVYEMQNAYIDNLKSEQKKLLEKTFRNADLRFEAFEEEQVAKLEELQSTLENTKLQSRLRISIALIILSLVTLIAAILGYQSIRRKKRIMELELTKEINNKHGEIKNLQHKLFDIATNTNEPQIQLPSFETINTVLNEKFSDREYEILTRLAKGLTNKEIAGEVFTSVNTVKYYLKKIYQKLDVNSRKEAVLTLAALNDNHKHLPSNNLNE